MSRSSHRPPVLLYAALVGLLLGVPGCRLVNRPNPQMPPEMRPAPGPRASTARTDEPEEIEPVFTGADPSAPVPRPADTVADNATDAAGASPAPLVPRTVTLPAAPQPGEGKSGRLLIEPMSPLPRDTADLPTLPGDPEFRRALATWDRGPIRYIILKEEQDLFRQLSIDEDRLLFIQSFWERRDRVIETTENEYRQEFWRRVSEADRRFIDSPQPGWKTDRGRVWIVMGPPDDQENFIGRRIGSAVLRWIYRQRPNLFLASNFIVAFRRSSSGEYQLSNDLRDFDMVFRDLEANIRPGIANPTVAFSQTAPTLQRVNTLSRLALFLDLGQATAPPELYRRMGKSEGHVETQEIFGAMDARTSYEFLGPLADGAIRTGIVVGVLKGSLVSEIDEDEADSSLTIDMSIYPGEIEGEGEVIRVRDGFGPSRENYVAPLSKRLVFRTELALVPGSYLAVFRILDRTSGQAAQARETFTVPDRFDTDFTLSTIVLARRLAPIDHANERPDAFTLGDYRVVPNLDATYRNGEDFAFYFQVNGASLEPTSGRRRLDVRYHFAALQGSDWMDLGESLVYRDLESPHGWTVPLVDWPPASYRLTVSVTDKVSSDTRSRSAYFRILPGS